MTKRHAATLPPQYLISELDERLTHGPVGLTLVFQLAEPGDRTDDPTTAWPEDRLLLPAGRLVVMCRHPDEIRWQRSVFDPTRTGEGVEVSDDPVLAFRPHAYAASAERRLTVDDGAVGINH